MTALVPVRPSPIVELVSGARSPGRFDFVYKVPSAFIKLLDKQYHELLIFGVLIKHAASSLAGTLP